MGFFIELSDRISYQLLSLNFYEVIKWNLYRSVINRNALRFSSLNYYGLSVKTHEVICLKFLWVICWNLLRTLSVIVFIDSFFIGLYVGMVLSI